MNIEGFDFAIFTLKTGDADDYTFALNGVDVNPSPVNDQKTIMRFEVNPNEVAVLKATNSDGKYQEFTFGTGTEAFTAVIEGETPDAFIAHGAVDVSDYYLSYWDENGDERTRPNKSTFDTENDDDYIQDDILPELWHGDTLASEDSVIKAGLVTDEDTAWFEAIYDVQIDQGLGSRTSTTFAFSIEQTPYGTNGLITLDKDAPSFMEERNGKFDIIIKADGYPEAKITIARELEAGKVSLSAHYNYIANQPLMFELDDYQSSLFRDDETEVYLNGEKLVNAEDLSEGEEGNADFRQVAGLITIGGDRVTSKLEAGKHTILVRINGYTDYVHEFTLREPNGSTEVNPEWVYANSNGTPVADIPMTIDAVSMATGGSSGGGSTSGGSIATPATLVFDFDLMTNAKILNYLGESTVYSTKVASFWNQMTDIDYVFEEDNQGKLLKLSEIKELIGTSADGDTYLTFADIYAKVLAGDEAYQYLLSGNAMYQVKYVLEYGGLGEAVYFSEVDALEAPVLTVDDKINVGDDIVITYSEVDGWEDVITGMVGKHNYLIWDADMFTVDKTNNTITIAYDDYKDSLSAGNIKFDIITEDTKYQNAEFSFELVEETVGTYTLSKNTAGELVIAGCDKAYVDSFGNDAMINGKDIHTTYIRTVADNIVIDIAKAEFDMADTSRHILVLENNGYATIRIEFVPAELVDTGDIASTVPENVKLVDTNTYETGDEVEITLGTDFLGSDYARNVTAVYLNDTLLEKGFYDSDDYSINSNDLTINGHKFPSAGSYTIKIEATEYQDKTFTFTVTEKTIKDVPTYVAVKNPDSYEEGDSVTITIGESYGDVYGEAVTDVIVNGVSQGAPFGSTTVTVYSSNLVVGTNTIVIKADGYEDATFTVNIAEYQKSFPTSHVYLIDENGVKEGDGKATAIKEGEKVTITLGYVSQYGSEYLDFAKANPVLTINDAVTSFTTSTKEVGSSYSKNTITYFELPALAVGENTITLKADGYHMGTFTVNVIGADETFPIPSDISLDSETVEMGESVEINIDFYDANQKAYYEALTSIVITPKVGDTITMDREGIVDAKGFSALFLRDLPVGEYTIKLIATDYADKTFNAEVTKATAPSNSVYWVDTEGNKDVNPIITEGETLNMFVGRGPAYNGATDYNFIKDNNAKIYVDDEEITTVSYIKINEEYGRYDNAIVLENLSVGEHTVTIQSANYADIVLNVTVEAKEGKPTPVGIKAEDDGWDGDMEIELYNSYDHFGDFKNPEYKTYAEAIISVTLNGAEQTLADIYNQDSIEITLNFTADMLVDGENTITIKATGYEDLTINYTK